MRVIQQISAPWVFFSFFLRLFDRPAYLDRKEAILSSVPATCYHALDLRLHTHLFDPVLFFFSFPPWRI